MTEEEYYAAVRRLGLKPSAVPNIYFTSTMDVHSVPSSAGRTPAQRAETIEKLKELLGITPAEDR
jgi:antitoxin component of RelBE/YafQ-DinJ toxin-antitoxin module